VNNFSHLLQATLTPVTLISGVGLRVLELVGYSLRAITLEIEANQS